MNGLETISETEIFESLEFEPDVACDSPVHLDGVSGHIPNQGASFYVLRSCCEIVTAMCYDSTIFLRDTQEMDGMVWCAICDSRLRAAEWFELGPVGKL